MIGEYLAPKNGMQYVNYRRTPLLIIAECKINGSAGLCVALVSITSGCDTSKARTETSKNCPTSEETELGEGKCTSAKRQPQHWS